MYQKLNRVEQILFDAGALFPALMYLFSVFMMVHYYAKKEKIVGERYPKTAWEIVRSVWI